MQVQDFTERLFAGGVDAQELVDRYLPGAELDPDLASKVVIRGMSGEDFELWAEPTFVSCGARVLWVEGIQLEAMPSEIPNAVILNMGVVEALSPEVMPFAALQALVGAGVIKDFPGMTRVNQAVEAVREGRTSDQLPLAFSREHLLAVGAELLSVYKTAPKGSGMKKVREYHEKMIDWIKQHNNGKFSSDCHARTIIFNALCENELLV